MTYTLAEVKSAGLPATWTGLYHGNPYVCHYLPGNPPQECIRIRSASGPQAVSFGPGGAPLAEGWRHAYGCGCEMCVVDG